MTFEEAMENKVTTKGWILKNHSNFDGTFSFIVQHGSERFEKSMTHDVAIQFAQLNKLKLISPND